MLLLGPPCLDLHPPLVKMESTRDSSLHSQMADPEKLDESRELEEDRPIEKAESPVNDDHGDDEEDEEEEEEEEEQHDDRTMPPELRRAPSNNDKAFLVDFEENDPTNPMKFSTVKKGFVTLQLGFTALTASLASSIIAPAEPQIASRFGVSQEATVLVISLYILGFAVGPMMWAPISGRYLSFVKIPGTVC